MQLFIPRCTRRGSTHKRPNLDPKMPPGKGSYFSLLSVMVAPVSWAI